MGPRLKNLSRTVFNTPSAPLSTPPTPLTTLAAVETRPPPPATAPTTPLNAPPTPGILLKVFASPLISLPLPPFPPTRSAISPALSRSPPTASVALPSARPILVLPSPVLSRNPRIVLRTPSPFLASDSNAPFSLASSIVFFVSLSRGIPSFLNDSRVSAILLKRLLVSSLSLLSCLASLRLVCSSAELPSTLSELPLCLNLFLIRSLNRSFLVLLSVPSSSGVSDSSSLCARFEPFQAPEANAAAPTNVVFIPFPADLNPSFILPF